MIGDVSSWSFCVRWSCHAISTLLKVTCSSKCGTNLSAQDFFGGGLEGKILDNLKEPLLFKKRPIMWIPSFPMVMTPTNNFFSVLSIKLSVVLAIMVERQVSHHNKGVFACRPHVHHILVEMYLSPCETSSSTKI